MQNLDINENNVQKKKHTLKWFCKDLCLKNDGVWVKINFGLRRVQEREDEGNRECLKNCHINLIKLKTRIFRGLGSREISCEKYHWSIEAFTRSF